MATLIPSGSDTLSALHTQTGGPVELHANVRRAAKAKESGSDTVQLSVSAQVRQLVQQGQSADQIADALGLTASLVNSYLYVPLSPVTVPVAAAGSSATVGGAFSA